MLVRKCPWLFGVTEKQHSWQKSTKISKWQFDKRWIQSHRHFMNKTLCGNVNKSRINQENNNVWTENDSAKWNHLSRSCMVRLDCWTCMRCDAHWKQCRPCNWTSMKNNSRRSHRGCFDAMNNTTQHTTTSRPIQRESLGNNNKIPSNAPQCIRIATPKANRPKKQPINYTHFVEATQTNTRIIANKTQHSTQCIHNQSKSTACD